MGFGKPSWFGLQYIFYVYYTCDKNEYLLKIIYVLAAVFILSYNKQLLWVRLRPATCALSGASSSFLAFHNIGE